jgi:hypothetical protein
MYKTEPSEDGMPLINKELLEGFCIDLAKRVAEEVGFEWTIHQVRDKSYGSQLENGTWNGMVGELIRHVSNHAISLSLIVILYIFAFVFFY